MKKMKFDFPNLSTERLIIRRIAEQDDLGMFSLRSDDRVNHFIKRAKMRDIQEARSFIQELNQKIDADLSLYWAITLKGHDDLIGTICLWNFSEDKTQAELGYELKPEFQGQGLMDEAVKAVVACSFESIGIQTLCAFTHQNNNASRRLLEKNGFELDPEQKDEGNVNNVIYELHLSEREDA